MTTETKTVTVELSVESAYDQLVGFQTAAKAFTEAMDKDDKDAMLSAADDAVESCINFINEVMPHDLSETLHSRLEEEHPELIPAEPSMEEILKQLFGPDFDTAAFLSEAGDGEEEVAESDADNGE